MKYKAEYYGDHRGIFEDNGDRSKDRLLLLIKKDGSTEEAPGLGKQAKMLVNAIRTTLVLTEIKMARLLNND